MSNFTDRTDNYPNLSRPFRSMRPEYDVVVIGSGYGAGVAASRMARAGKSVAVLELGWERRSGSFPQTFSQCLKNTSISGSSVKGSFISKWLSPGDPTRLFQVFLGDGQHSFAAHGLGGSSLINAGVFLKADKRTLQMSPWPSEIRDQPSALDEYYARAETMLQPSTYPDDSSPNKLKHLQEESRWLGKRNNFYRVPLTIFFHNGCNNAGVPMQANRQSGHECTGLNDGSKNSVATTYLADAWNWGAEIFCGCEVRFVENMDGGGYTIRFAWHGSGRSVFADHFKEQLFWVKAKEFCFLGAGALGTTEVLLRSKQHGLHMSPLVGSNLSGNGDFLIFGYNGYANINGIAGESSRAPPGTTVTAVIDNRVVDPLDNPLSGYVIQDGCIPAMFNPVIQIMLTLQTMKSQALCCLWNPRQEAKKTLASLKSLLFGPYAYNGALQRTSTYLVMSHDSNEITLTLKDDRLCLRGPAEGRSEHFKWIKNIFNETFARTGSRMGFSYFYGRHQEETTVHLLGGANMSNDGTGHGGVTNHLGEVFSGSNGEVYKGLVCCDASIIPTALGVNPLATISALSERSVSLITERSELSIDLETENQTLNAYCKPSVSCDSQDCQDTKKASQSIGWQFTETMHGHISMRSDIGSFALSERVGKGSSCAMRMFLTIEICRGKKSREPSSSRMLTCTDLQYQGICTGTISCYALSRATLKIVEGTVDFFTPIEENAESSAISYHLKLLSVEGIEYRLKGHKLINSNMAFSARKTWEATTTVNVNITRLDGTNIGAGALHISLLDFQKQMRTFRTTKDFQISLVLALVWFLVSFIYHISLFFFRPFVRMRFPQISTKGTDVKQLASTSCSVTASDGVQIYLDIYDPLPAQKIGEPRPNCNLAPVLLLPGVTGIGAMHNLYSLPFLRCNMVEYLTQRGHRCYALTPRWGCDPAVAQKSTVFDCRLDVAAAIAYIRDKERQKPYVVAHCQGSVALCMGLLDGTIQSSQLLGITANSVFMNQVFGYWNSLKGRTTLLIQFYELLAGNYFPIVSSAKSVLFQRLLDTLLRLYPVGHTRDICTSTACHRTSFAFGLLWNHENLDMSLHDNVHLFFAGTHTKLMKHVVRMGTRGICMDTDSCPLLTDENLQRLQGLPILFVSGTENQVFSPESTLKDYELLRRRFGERLYRRFLVEGYGHLDPIVGKDAAEDVYWRIFAHLRWCTKEAESTNLRAK
ncbi:CAZyme family AA3 [Penicillium psychrosexuale]|uniref:CAZyme family AA3 n=1 Tax=Penicillium psychrosexuale TaxID=1002107 RepID=UPI002545A7AF|nr:CAZyme family AA3 [Penicillium psychrosexuale]KAJ5781624.1 CAZyme family AA3 [Penicillium psychrosexuale]